MFTRLVQNPQSEKPGTTERSRKTKKSKWLKPRYWLRVLNLTAIVCLAFVLFNLFTNFPSNTISESLSTCDDNGSETQALIESAADQKLTRLIAENEYLKTQIISQVKYRFPNYNFDVTVLNDNSTWMVSVVQLDTKHVLGHFAMTEYSMEQVNKGLRAIHEMYSKSVVEMLKSAGFALS